MIVWCVRWMDAVLQLWMLCCVCGSKASVSWEYMRCDVASLAKVKMFVIKFVSIRARRIRNIFYMCVWRDISATKSFAMDCLMLMVTIGIHYIHAIVCTWIGGFSSPQVYMAMSESARSQNQNAVCTRECVCICDRFNLMFCIRICAT